MTNLKIRQQQRENSDKLTPNSKTKYKPTDPYVNNRNGEKEIARRKHQIDNKQLKVS